MTLAYSFEETAKNTLALRATRPGEIETNEPNSGPAHTAIFLNRKGERCDTPGFDSAAKLLAGAWLSRHHNVEPGYTIAFEDRSTVRPGQLLAWEPAAPLDASTDAPLEITGRIALSGPALNTWLETPPERAATYLQWFAQVSFDVQSALRRWMPYLMLREPAILNDPALRNSLLFYAASKPYFARVRGVFTWDVICPDSMSSVYRSGSQHLPRILDQAQRYIVASGREDLAGNLAPSETRTVLIQVRRDPRALKALLTMDAKLVEALAGLGAKANELAATDTAPQNLHRFCAEWSRAVQTRLRRVLGAVYPAHIVDLALVEGTASLAKCAGIETARAETWNGSALGLEHNACESQLDRAA